MFDESAVNAVVWQPLREKLEENVWHQGNSSWDANCNFQYFLLNWAWASSNQHGQRTSAWTTPERLRQLGSTDGQEVSGLVKHVSEAGPQSRQWLVHTLLVAATTRNVIKCTCCAVSESVSQITQVFFFSRRARRRKVASYGLLVSLGLQFGKFRFAKRLLVRTNLSKQTCASIDI
jgi:hypothetical protein